jgi:hypothetical protein
MREERTVAQRAVRCMLSVMLGVTCGGAVTGWSAYAEEEEARASLPTIAILEELAAEAGREVSPSLPGDTASTVVLEVEPGENTWFVEAGFMKGLAPRPVVREPGPNAAVSVSIGIRMMGVAYEDVRRDGLFGSRVVTRTVFMEADVSVVSRTTGDVLHRSTVARTRRDDVRVDDLARLEEPGLTWTTGKVPPEGFFSSVLEPVITLGAIAVAVILLFTVRS